MLDGVATFTGTLSHSHAGAATLHETDLSERDLLDRMLDRDESAWRDSYVYGDEYRASDEYGPLSHGVRSDYGYERDERHASYARDEGYGPDYERELRRARWTGRPLRFAERRDERQYPPPEMSERYRPYPRRR